MALGQRYFHGARAKLWFGGKEVGHMTDLSCDRTFETLPIKECGSDHVQAHVLMGEDVSLSAGFYRIVDEDFYQQNIMPSGEEGSLVDWPELTAVIYDRVTGDPMWEVQGCIPTRESHNFASRSPCSTNTSWVGRIFKHTSEL